MGKSKINQKMSSVADSEQENSVEATVGSYEGERNEIGQRHGQGKAILSNGDSYEGAYVDGMRNGFGTYRFRSGARYRGYYTNGKKNGKGVMHYPDGSIYEGDWVEDERQGSGKYTFINGDIYEGNWDKNSKNGEGSYFVSSTAAMYKGTWNNDIIHGFVEIDYGVCKYIGYMNNGKVDGQGKMVFKNGYILNGHYKTITNEEESKERQVWVAQDLTS